MAHSDDCGSAQGNRVTALSIIMPVLDEAAMLPAALQALAPLRTRGVELIVVDGGSRDQSADVARPHVNRVLAAKRGRATQMNAGARIARGEALLFLHADTQLPAEADRLALEALRQNAWGRFDVTITGKSPLLRVVACLMNGRSRLTGIATGDQAIFVRREAFMNIGGFPEIPLMEDIALSRALKRIGRPACLHARVRTSDRRWERDGVMRTILSMWRLRFAFFCGADPAVLARRYGYGER